MSYEHRVRVRYAETDQMGVVHHGSYVLYFEEARTAYMASLGCPYGDLEKAGIGLAVRKMNVRYRAPAVYEDELIVDTHIERVRGASLAFRYEIRRASDGTRLVDGETDLACIGLEGTSRTPRPLPDSLQELLGRHRVDG